MILWNSAQTRQEIRKYMTIGKYMTIVKIFVYNAHPSCKIQNLDNILCIMHKKLRYSNYFKIFPILNYWSTNSDNVILI